MTSDELAAAQRSSSEQGREFEQAARFLLKAAGWTIVDTNSIVDGIEVDIVAIDPEGNETFVECKGSYRGDQPGLIRSDTLKKAVANAYHLFHGPTPEPYVIVTSHKPKPNSRGARLLARAVAIGAVADVIVIGANL